MHTWRDLAVRLTVLGCSVAVQPFGAARAQQSDFALRFVRSSIGDSDRVRIPIDDNIPGPDLSQPSDVGLASFTIEFWIRGNETDNPTTNSGGDGEYSDERWPEGNGIGDRAVPTATQG